VLAKVAHADPEPSVAGLLLIVEAKVVRRLSRRMSNLAEKVPAVA
jgi:hypothetical protein